MTTATPQQVRRYPTEAQEQEAVFAWAASRERREPRLRLLHASMNGILTDPRFGAKLKRQGRKAGVPDILLPVPRIDRSIEHYGLWIELKREKGGLVSSEQIWWHQQLTEMGYRVVVARGAKAAIEEIERYLSDT